VADRDPEALHHMRVGLRRLRTAQQVFHGSLPCPPTAGEPQVAQLARKLGRLRDLDVLLLALTEHYCSQLPPAEQQRLAPVVAQQQKRRKRAVKRTRRVIQGKAYHRLKRDLQAWQPQADLPDPAALPVTMAVPDLVLPLVCQLWLHPGWLVGTQAGRDRAIVPNPLSPSALGALLAHQGERLHSLRKQVKRVRYQLQLVADLYGSALEPDIQRFSEIQGVLGDLQDAAVLAALLQDCHPQATQHWPTLFALLAQQQHKAWAQWQTHQRYYLTAAHRQSLRQRLAMGAPPAAAIPDPVPVRPDKPPQPRGFQPQI